MPAFSNKLTYGMWILFLIEGPSVHSDVSIYAAKRAICTFTTRTWSLTFILRPLTWNWNQPVHCRVNRWLLLAYCGETCSVEISLLNRLTKKCTLLRAIFWWPRFAYEVPTTASNVDEGTWQIDFCLPSNLSWFSQLVRRWIIDLTLSCLETSLWQDTDSGETCYFLAEGF